MHLHRGGDRAILPADADHGQGTRMAQAERRTGTHKSGRTLRAELSEAQLDTLAELERYGWELKFIRHPLFQDPVAVLMDPDRKDCAVLARDGVLQAQHRLRLRGH